MTNNSPFPHQLRHNNAPMVTNYVSPAVIGMNNRIDNTGHQTFRSNSPHQIVKMEQVNRSKSGSRIIHGAVNPRASSQ